MLTCYLFNPPEIRTLTGQWSLCQTFIMSTTLSKTSKYPLKAARYHANHFGTFDI